MSSEENNNYDVDENNNNYDDSEPYLSFASLTDDRHAIQLNGKPDYELVLPRNIENKRASERMKILKDVILSGCTKYGVNYVSEDTIINTAKEIVDILFEHANENASVDREFGGDGGGDGGDDNNNNRRTIIIKNHLKPEQIRLNAIQTIWKTNTSLLA